MANLNDLAWLFFGGGGNLNDEQQRAYAAFRYLQFAVFSRTGTIAADAAVSNFPVPKTGVVESIWISVGSAPSGSSITCDLNKNGTTMFTTQANRPTIASGSLISTAAVPDVTTITAGDLLSVDVDTIGSITPGSYLTAVVVMRVG